ncbi:MAG TPA: NUDIX domain-containing protein [Actinoplanes sp.]|nr:NUDIX domain-containing protein [Actinoplanes sp.]
MSTSGYILKLREKIGHEMLWLPGVSVLILNEKNELLLALRSDDGTWGVLGGFVEPGEQPADAVVRETFEEAGLVVEPLQITSVIAYERNYPNGDQCRYLDTAFRCRIVEGKARVNDDESLALDWFPLDRLPDVNDHDRRVIAHAFSGSAEAWYTPPSTAQLTKLGVGR